MFSVLILVDGIITCTNAQSEQQNQASFHVFEIELAENVWCSILLADALGHSASDANSEKNEYLSFNIINLTNGYVQKPNVNT